MSRDRGGEQHTLACTMRTSTYTPEQVAAALRQAESGAPVAEICRKLQVTETTF